MAYVEVKAKTVEMAIEAAMRELGVTDRQRLEVEVLQDAERGFLGFGGRDAIVKVQEKSGGRGRGRSRKGRKSEGRDAQGGAKSEAGRQGAQKESSGSGKGSGQRSNGPGQGGGRSRSGNGGNGGERRQGKPSSGRSGGKVSQGNSSSKRDDDREEVGIEAQEPIVGEFLTGLVGAFGLEGSVETRIEDDVVVAEVKGDQTEALVGPRGSVMEAVHELTKTVLQRTAQDSARVRLDVAGYAQRRRQALTIYAGELIDQVVGDGGELMLEPMSASDRKVIHDAVGEREGVRSYSEGESPQRYVVLAAEGGEDAASDAAEDSESGDEEE